MKKMKRIEIAQYIALGATCLTVLGFVLSGIFGGRIPMSMMGYGVMAGIVSYFFGGFGTAVRMAGKIAKWGWLIVPFPYDIVTGMVSFFISNSKFTGVHFWEAIIQLPNIWYCSMPSMAINDLYNGQSANHGIGH